ncbi:MAG: NAD(P)-dependent oxidoreductase [Thermodesulfobacteriota bacterium]|nr:MAG: NAD(P)-dependent oxidoreductase [Thermodesulfobacteriota bacterium]
MKSILVTGSRGQVGTEIRRLAQQRNIIVVATDKKELDITQLDNIERVIKKNKSSIVINAAAYTAVDKAEEETDRAFSVNREGSANLAQACKNAGIPLLHISTDYVFNGDKDEPYKETDKPAPTSIYGKSKLEGEEAIRKILQQYLILRTSWVFSASGQSFPKTMLRMATERDTLGVVADQFGAPTWAGDIARVLLDITSDYLQGNAINWGLYHYTGTPNTNWFEFAKIIFEQSAQENLLKQTPNLSTISTENYPTSAKRPKNSVLNCDKIQKELGIKQPNWYFGLNSILNDWKNSEA